MCTNNNEILIKKIILTEKPNIIEENFTLKNITFDKQGVKKMKDSLGQSKTCRKQTDDGCPIYLVKL